MTNSVIQSACQGQYWPCSIKIVYDFQELYGKRIAYLPNSPRGRKILAKLQIAFDRRLVFSMGVLWNFGLAWSIHHKTSLNGGGTHGFPDETYLDRLEEELKERGVGDELMEEIANKKRKGEELENARAGPWQFDRKK
jgi:hypothetical protein